MAKANLTAGARAHIFLPITKIDVVQRLVYARITDETVDAAKEICDYDSSAPLFKKWSENAMKVTAGKSAGNLRAMHGPTAAGKLTELDCDDVEKTIDCVAKVVDDAEWEKCLEGVYTGLSLGGSYVGKKWKDAATGAMRYTVDPVEVSLVDLPCNPSATFQMVKGEGLEPVDVAFKPWEPTAAETAAKATELAKAVSADANFADYLGAARDALVADRANKVVEGEDDADAEAVAELEAVAGEDTKEAAEGAGEDTIEGGSGNDSVAGGEGADSVSGAEGGDADKVVVATDWGVDQVFMVKADGSTHAKKADALAHVAALKQVETVGGADVLAAAIAKAKKGAEPAVEEPAAEPGELAVAMKADAEGLSDLSVALKAIAAVDGSTDSLVFKSMYSVGRFAELLDCLAGVQCSAAWEAEYENDGSKVASMIADGIKTLAGAFKAMAEEEVSELLENLKLVGVDVIEVITLAAAPEATKGLDVLKAIAGNQELVEKAGARNSKGDAAKIQTIHDMACKLGGACAEKIEDAEVTKIIGERDTFKTQIETALPQIEEMGVTMKAMRGELDALKAAPAPMPTIVAGSTVVSRAAGGEDVLDPADVTPESAAKFANALVSKFGIEAVQNMMMKVAQANPLHMRPA